MNHLQIAYFLAVAQCKSFSEAARQLFVAQSAISKQIQALEKSLGIKLFIRTNRNVELTPAGEIMFRELLKYNNWLSKIVDMAKQIDQGKAGVLNIGILHGLDLSANKVNSFTHFVEMYPDIQINTERVKLEDAEHALYVGTHDIIITYSFLVPDRRDIGVALLGMEEDNLIVSRNHPLGKQSTIRKEDLVRYNMITIDPGVSRYAYLNSLKYFSDIEITPQNVNHVQTIEDIILSVEFGLGYGVCSQSSRLAFNKETFRFIDMYFEEGKQPPQTEILAIWRANNTNPAIKYYESYLKAELGIPVTYQTDKKRDSII